MDVKALFDELKQTITQRDEVNSRYQDEVKLHGEALTETKEALDRIENAVNEVADRLSKAETEVQRARMRFDPSDARQGSKAQERHVKAFEDWMRKGRGVEGQLYDAAQEAAEEQRAITGISDSGGTAGGHAVPELIQRQIDRLVLDLSPFRGAVNVINAGGPDVKLLVDTLGTASGWVGESDARSETATPGLQQVAPTHGELYALPKTSEWALNDIFFDVANWLTTSVAEEFAYQEGEAIVNGDGTNKPSGFLGVGTPVAIGDEDSPARAFGTLEYVPTGAASTFGNDRVGSPPGDPGDTFIDCVYKLKARYRANARWSMNKATLGTVRKFHDADGNYLWAPGMQAGEPGRLIGYPVLEAEAMPDVGANAFPVAFGDFRAAYTLVDIVGMRMTRDDNLTAKGFVLFYTRRRMGGILRVDDPLKLIKIATS